MNFLNEAKQMSVIRKEVINCFKKLHIARRVAFDGDERALEAARQKINEEFKKNKELKDDTEIEKLVKLAKNVEMEIRTNIIQAEETKPGVYRLKITKDTKKLDNVMFDENAELPPPRTKRCSDVK